MIKPALKICLFLLPIMLIYGVIRVNFLGYPVAYFETTQEGLLIIHWGEMLPTWQDFLAKWEQFPNLWGDVEEAIRVFNNSVSTMQTSFSQVTDIIQFFKAMGDFFIMIGSALMIAVQVISIPIKTLYWVFAILFAPYVD